MRSKIVPTRKKSYEEVYYYVYLYEEFQNNFFVRQKVVDEELATRKLLFDGQKSYFEATSTNIRSSIPTRSVFDEESP